MVYNMNDFAAIIFRRYYTLISTYMYKPLTHPAKRFSNLLPDFLLLTAFKIPFYFSQTLNRRYSNHAADVKKLKLAEARIQVNVAFFLSLGDSIFCAITAKKLHTNIMVCISLKIQSTNVGFLNFQG